MGRSTGASRNNREYDEGSSPARSERRRRESRRNGSTTTTVGLHDDVEDDDDVKLCQLCGLDCSDAPRFRHKATGAYRVRIAPSSAAPEKTSGHPPGFPPGFCFARASPVGAILVENNFFFPKNK